MIPVIPKPEPAAFNAAVRVPGNAWLTAKQLVLTAPLPKAVNPPPHWRSCLDDLHSQYQGVCAYLAVYIERATGATSVDHFVAKSKNAGLTYEWSNYRLACLSMNARKRAFDDVLDPFVMPDGVFHLELVSGRIFVNPSLTGKLAQDAEATITRLRLDCPNNREIRVRHFQYYAEEAISQGHLKKMSPFVWAEANRQGLLSR